MLGRGSGDADQGVVMVDQTDIENRSNAPWFQRTEWADNHIACSQKLQFWFAWIFAVFWNLISTPLVFVLPGEIIGGNYPALIGLLFPLVGIGLVIWAIRVTREWRTFGTVFLQLDPFPGAIGAQVGGSLDLHLPYDPARHFQVTLNCLYSYVSGSGKNRSTREKLVWQTEGIATQISRSHGIRLEFLFDVPHNLPASEPHNLPYHSWRVDIKCADPAVGFARQFVIPVYPGERSARYPRDKSAEHPALTESHVDQIESFCEFTQVAGGVELFFPAFRRWRTALAGVAFGGIFAASGIGIGYSGGPVIFPFVFGIVGGITLLVSLDNLLGSRRVRLDEQGYRAHKWLLGIPVNKTEIPRAQLRRMKLKESYSRQSGTQHTKVYKIQMELDSGKTVSVASGVPGEALARRLMENIGLYSGISV